MNNPNRAEIGSKIFANSKFWKKFLRFFSVGISFIVLLYAAQTMAFTKIQEAQAIQGCTLTAPASYPQCGTGSGSCINSGPIDSSHTVMVTPQVNAGCSGIEYSCQDLGVKQGECGNNPLPTVSCPDDLRYCDTNINKIVYKHGGVPDSSQPGGCRYAFDAEGPCGVPAPVPTPTPTPTPIPTPSSSPSCTLRAIPHNGNAPLAVTLNAGLANSSGFPVRYKWDFDGNGSWDVEGGWTDFTTTSARGLMQTYTYSQSGTFNPKVYYEWSTPGVNTSCSTTVTVGGAPATPTPTSAPASTPAPAPAVCTPANDSCNAQTPLSCGQVNQGRDSCGNVCFRQSAACPVSPPPPPPSTTTVYVPASVPPPIGGPITITNNPTNTNTSSSTSSSSSTANNTNNISFGNIGVGGPQPVAVVQPVVVQPQVVQPQVAGVTVTQLPKTGLPMLAWSVLAFIPAGFRMRGFRKIKKEMENDPQFLWEERQFKTGS